MAELWIVVTAGAYAAALLLRRRVSSPLLNPTLLTMVALAVVLVATRVPYASYASGTSPLTALLGPAVVALAVLGAAERQRRHLRERGRPGRWLRS